jgi:hypothetical protein
VVVTLWTNPTCNSTNFDVLTVSDEGNCEQPGEPLIGSVSAICS